MLNFWFACRFIICSLFSFILTIGFTQNADDAIDFDGTDDYIESGSNIGIIGSTSRTVEAWIKTTNSSGQRVIVDFGANSSGARFTFVVNGGLIRIEIQDTGIPGSLVSDGNWHHVAVVYDNTITNDYTLFVDGVIDVSANLTTANTSASNLFIGRRAVGTSYFDGEIDEVRVWNVARSASEILENMHKDLTTASEPNLVAYYKMDHLDGETTITDSKGGNDGTWSGSGGSNTTSNFESSYAVIGNATSQGKTNVRSLWQGTGTGVSLISAGLAMRSGSILSEANYATFGHNDDGTGTTTSNLGSSAAVERFSQGWYVGEEGTVSDGSFIFDLGNIAGSSVTPVDVGNYRLLYRFENSGDFSDEATAIAIINTDQVVFAGISLQDGYYTIGSTTALFPVVLTSFNGQTIDNDIHLNWETSSEINNDGFLIEWSRDSRTWENIGFIKSLGESSDLQSYQFIHEHPSSKINYYRLKQMDFDGKFEYSSIVNVYWEAVNPQLFISPNPIQNGSFTLSFSDSNFETGELSIFDFTGRLVHSETILDTKIDVQVNELPKGTYLVEVKSRGKRLLERMIVK